MHVAVGAISLALIALILAEFFVTYLLPRRVKRDPRLARQLYAIAWRPWRAISTRLRPAAADTFLGLFGPLGLIAVLAIWTVGLILAFAGLQWAAGSHLRAGAPVGFGDDLYFSAAAFFSASTGLTPATGLGHAIRVAEAASAFGVLFIVIGYLPSLYQAYSRREVAVSQLDARAGSPPTAEMLLRRSAAHGGWEELDEYLKEWEVWAAELMETHLSYPLLAYFRSQHVHQNWLSALVTIMDTCAFALAASPAEGHDGAAVTYAIGRHALADITFVLKAHPFPPPRDRLPAAELAEVREPLAEAGLDVGDDDAVRDALGDLREGYEPYAQALADKLQLSLPAWRAPDVPEQNWQRTAWRVPHGKAVP